MGGRKKGRGNEGGGGRFRGMKIPFPRERAEKKKDGAGSFVRSSRANNASETHGIRQPLVEAVQYRRAPHHVPETATVPPAVVEDAVQLDLPPAAGGARQSLPEAVQSTQRHAQDVRYARIREHRRDDAPSLLIIIEVVWLPRRQPPGAGAAGAGGEGRGGYAEGGGDGGKPDVGGVEIGEGCAAAVVVIVEGGGAPGA